MSWCFTQIRMFTALFVQNQWQYKLYPLTNAFTIYVNMQCNLCNDSHGEQLLRRPHKTIKLSKLESGHLLGAIQLQCVHYSHITAGCNLANNALFLLHCKGSPTPNFWLTFLYGIKFYSNKSLPWSKLMSARSLKLYIVVHLLSISAGWQIWGHWVSINIDGCYFVVTDILEWACTHPPL